MSAPQYLDLDALVAVQKVLKFQGEEYALAEITVDDFIVNVELVQKLGSSPSFKEEMETVITMLKRAFPTFPEDKMRKLPLSALNRILAFAQANDGSEKVADEVGAKVNPPPAA